MITRTLTLAALIGVVASALPALARGAGAGPAGVGGYGGGYGGAGGYVRMTAADRVRQQVGFTDDEWTVIQPKLQKVIDAQSALQAYNARRNFGGQAGPNTPTPPALIAQQELASVLQDQNAPVDAIATKLKALRDARARAKEDLARSQDDLKKVLTVRQEAILVELGYLE